MQLGSVIKNLRKEKNLTQKELAKRLGVTAPAVNKWENGHTLPDISLLSPIARLLDISIDTLLSHEKELSDAEANILLKQADEKLKSEPLEEAFLWIKNQISQFPNCYFMILYMAIIFDSHRQIEKLSSNEKHEEFIINCYEQALESEKTKTDAAEALFSFYMNKENYEKAESYLDYFSLETDRRKQKQAMIYSKTGRREEAYKMIEELIYTGYNNLNATFQENAIIALEENDLGRARVIFEKIQKLAELFEFGEYHEVSPWLELAIISKNEEETIRIAKVLINNTESIGNFTRSALFSHMEFKELDKAYIEDVRESIIEGFKDEKVYSYLQKNEEWKEFIGIKD